MSLDMQAGSWEISMANKVTFYRSFLCNGFGASSTLIIIRHNSMPYSNSLDSCLAHLDFESKNGHTVQKKVEKHCIHES